jgi:hypothetical protein
MMLTLASGRVAVVRVDRRTPHNAAATTITDGVPSELTLGSPKYLTWFGIT